MDKEQARRLSRWTLQAAARELVGSESVAFCFRKLAFNAALKRQFSTVDVCYSAAVRRAHYKHLFICASVWMCPICAAKISERRRIELSQAIEQNAADVVPVLVTFTLSHTRGDKLPVVLSAMLSAYRRMKSGRWWKEFQARYSMLGSVRGLEVTFGQNAWHPHLHCLFFFKRVGSLEIENELKARWSESLKKEKRGASFARGVTVRFGGADVANYVSKLGAENVTVDKWSLSHELAKSAVKVSKQNGKTPMQLLGEYANGNKKSGHRWREYALAFKGRHQLVWSRGLRSRLGIGKEESDEQIAKREDESAVLLASLSLSQWKIVLSQDARGELLQVADSGDVASLWNFLHSLGVE